VANSAASSSAGSGEHGGTGQREQHEERARPDVEVKAAHTSRVRSVPAVAPVSITGPDGTDAGEAGDKGNHARGCRGEQHLGATKRTGTRPVGLPSAKPSSTETTRATAATSSDPVVPPAKDQTTSGAAAPSATDARGATDVCGAGSKPNSSRSCTMRTISGSAFSALPASGWRTCAPRSTSSSPEQLDVGSARQVLAPCH
jgi:hypothetical protein